MQVKKLIYSIFIAKHGYTMHLHKNLIAFQNKISTTYYNSET